MIKIETMDGLERVDPTNLASAHVAEAAIINAITQGQGGWGVRRNDAVVLKLARDLKIALELSTKADSAQKGLVGKRLELGRAKAATTRAEVMLTQERAVVAGLKIALENMTVKAQGYREAAKASEAAAFKHQARVAEFQEELDRSSK